MAKLVLNDITNIDTSVNALNTNFALIENALENTVSRNGTSPNQLEADLDLNSQDILNVGTITAAEAIIGGSSVAGSAAAAAASAASAASSANAALTSRILAFNASASAASSAAIVRDWDYIGNWVTATLYLVNNITYNTTEGNSYICLVEHTSGVFGDDYSAGKWGLLAVKGAAGAGTGDMLKSENLSGLADYATARANMGLAIGTNVQAQDATLQALAGTLTAANKIPYATALDTAGELDFKDEDTMVSDSATAIPSQQSVKAYVDAAIVPAGAIMQFAMSLEPSGWLKANGAAVSRVTYAALFTAIGITFGAGDGVTTFNLPDLRGEFIRGFDDARGVDSGRVFGSAQADDLKAHTHTYTKYGSLLGGLSGGGSGWANTATVDSGSTGTTETRPRNIALLACIKY